MLYKDRIKQVQEEVWKSLTSPDCSPLQVDEITALLYSPNPETGLPDSSLGLVLSGKSNSEVQEYVKDRLFIEGNKIYGSSADSADDALESVTPMDLQYGFERKLVANYHLDRFKKLIKKVDK